MADELTEQYLASLLKSIETIKTLVREYRDGNPDTKEKIRLLAHSLHGSGASYGFPEISVAAKATEYATEAELLKQLTALMNVLKQVTTNPSPTPEPEPPPPAVENKGPVKILVIEDDPDIAAMVRSTIYSKSADFEVVIAETARKGMDLLLRSRFALLVLDLMLPDKDGRDVLRDIKFEFKLPVPVFVLSAIEKDVVRVECMSYGADKYFTKPLDTDALYREIDKTLSKNPNRKLSLVPLGDKEPDRDAVRPAALQTNFSGTNILLAEDDPSQANLIRKRLLQEGFTVELVDNGQAALAALGAHSFSLAILDVNMPKFNGFEVLERLRSDPKTAELPVIIVTAMDGEKDIIRGYDLGANDYLLKPFLSVQLVARIKTLLK